jgi:hypothetical protein
MDPKIDINNGNVIIMLLTWDIVATKPWHWRIRIVPDK